MSTLDHLRYIVGRLDAIEAVENSILTTLGELMSALSDLTAQVAESKAVEDSALLLINGISGRIADAAGDPTALTALSDELKTSATDLAAAVAANTPATAPPAAPGAAPTPDPLPAPGDSPTTTAGSAGIAPVDPSAPVAPQDPNTDPANAAAPPPPAPGA